MNSQHMRFIRHISATQPILDELDNQPELWNFYNFRTQFYPNSPHRYVSDIWLRYRDYADFNKDDPVEFGNNPDANYENWYGIAYLLPHVMQMIHNLVITENIERLGGCLITKIPPGKMVYPHVDKSYHAEFYKDKYLLLLQGDIQQAFCFDGEMHKGNAGDLFWFENQSEHWVENNSDIPRISLLIAARNKE